MPSTSDDPEVLELLIPSESSSQAKQPEFMGREEQFSKAEGRKGDVTAKYAASAAAAVFLTVTWILVLSNKPTSVGWFAFHPLLQTLSISFFTWGILTLQPTSQPKTKAAGLMRHQAAMLLLGFPCILLGTTAVSYYKWLRGADHLTTWHGTFGIGCVAWLIIQVLIGGGSVWFGGAAFGGGSKAKAVWKYHRLSGYILFPMLLVTAHLGGGWSHWGEKHAGKALRLVAYTVAPVVMLGSIYVRMRLSKMKFS